jgi:hypothetical protein
MDEQNEIDRQVGELIRTIFALSSGGARNLTVSIFEPRGILTASLGSDHTGTHAMHMTDDCPTILDALTVLEGKLIGGKETAYKPPA